MNKKAALSGGLINRGGIGLLDRRPFFVNGDLANASKIESTMSVGEHSLDGRVRAVRRKGSGLRF